MSSQEIWVVAQVRGGRLAPVTYEAMTAASVLVEGGARGARLAVFVAHPQAAALAADCFAHGAHKVYLAPVASDQWVDDQQCEILASAIREHHPRVVLTSASTSGKALFPRLAARCDGAFVPDATRLTVEGGLLQVYRPCFGGNVVRKIQARSAIS